MPNELNPTASQQTQTASTQPPQLQAQPAANPLTRGLLGYALAFALAFIAAKWGITPTPPQAPVVVMPTLASPQPPVTSQGPKP